MNQILNNQINQIVNKHYNGNSNKFTSDFNTVHEYELIAHPKAVRDFIADQLDTIRSEYAEHPSKEALADITGIGRQYARAYRQTQNYVANAPHTWLFYRDDSIKVRPVRASDMKQVRSLLVNA